MGYEQQIHEQASALGGEVAAALQPAREWLAKADQLNEALKTARAAEEAEYGRLVEAAASSGKLPELNGHGRWIFDSPASKATIAAVAQCHIRASAAARSAGPALFEALQARVKAVVEESARLAATVSPGVVDEGTAFRAKQHDTWTRLRQLVDSWTACFELLAVLQRAGWVDGPAHPRDRDGAVVYQRYLRPLSLPPGYWKGRGELRLAKAVASNAKPGLYPWADAVARWERLDRRQRNYASMEVIRRHDRFGAVVSEEHGPETAGDFVPSAGRP